jgi:hypothetical protein
MLVFPHYPTIRLCRTITARSPPSRWLPMMVDSETELVTTMGYDTAELS